ncbi:MAG: Delta-aminolevulinic acid dehydratase [Thermoanaerobacterales bacterium 50_218]|nr:MAG: Delta-aminolevulinic acid dehydratase [Thermoanaerobacterales bacterium 50_218]HAA89583.1 porphobilinogen synthase [Peptococcaceae bacterium]
MTSGLIQRGFPQVRLRRLRRTPALRELVQETRLSVEDLIYPLFVQPGSGLKSPVASMPGVFRFSPDLLLEEVAAAVDLGILAVLLFGLPHYKDELGTAAYDDQGIVQETVRMLKKHFPDLVVITDVCLCGYTSHGHCGVVRDGEVDNDQTLPLIAEIALSHARAGADIVAPSDMMDGRVKAIREKLDAHGFSQVAILAYAAKFASAFYGPFREAADSSPGFGDRRSYQMNPANRREALQEVLLDVAEGADLVMVKPALAYLDVIREVRETVLCPVVAYNVSGEYSLVKAAAAEGWVDERQVVLEILTGIKRAGADLIITYFAKDAAQWLRQG